MPLILVIGVAVAWILLSAMTGEAKVSSSSVPANVLRWSDMAQRWAQTYSILDPEEILAIIWSESSGNSGAMNPNDPSWGLMGVTPLIAHAYGGFDAADTSWHMDPEKNVKAGAGFLADLKSRYSADYPGWVAAYNEGETNLLRGYKDQGYVDRFNSNLAALKGNV